MELLLHLSLDNIRNFAVVAARTRIGLPLGWPGQATVSGSVPGASFLGIILSVTECPGRYLQVPGHITRRHARLQHVQGRDFGRIASLWPLLTRRSFGMISFHTGQDDELAYYTILENMVVYKHFSDSIRLRQHPGDHQTGKYHHLVALI